MKRFQKASFAEFAKTYKGWLAGAFFPPESPLHSMDVEIRHGIVSGTEIAFPPHYHSHRVTYILVTKGELTFKLDRELVVIAAGEYVVFHPGVIEEGISAKPDTELIIIRTPSTAKEDKVDVSP